MSKTVEDINSSLLALVRGTKGVQDNNGMDASKQTLNAGSSNLYGGLLLQQLQQVQREQQNQNSLIGGLDAMDPNMLAGLGLSAAGGNGSANGILGLMGLSQQQSVPDLSNRKKELSGGAKKRKKKEKEEKLKLEKQGSQVPGELKANASNTKAAEGGGPPAPSANSAETGTSEAPTKQRSRAKSSHFRGVSRCAKDGRWQARIRIGRSVKYLGRYKTEMDAAKRYDIAAKKYHGVRAVLNFSEMTNLSIADLEEGDKGPESKSDDESRDHQTDTSRKHKRASQIGGTPLPGQSKLKKQRRSSAMPVKAPFATTQVQPRRNSVPTLSSDIYNQSNSYQQLLSQMSLLGAASIREQMLTQQENRLTQASLGSNAKNGASNPLLASLAAGMLSGTGHLSNYRIASTVPSDAVIASQLSPASKSMTGAISGLISLNQTQL